MKEIVVNTPSGGTIHAEETGVAKVPFRLRIETHTGRVICDNRLSMDAVRGLHSVLSEILSYADKGG